MQLVNLTPHPIVLRPPGLGEDDDTQDVVINSSGTVRCSVSRVLDGGINGWPLSKIYYGPPAGLPEPREGVFLIVSNIVLNTVARDDIIAPDTGPTAIRDPYGSVVAVRGFIR